MSHVMLCNLGGPAPSSAARSGGGGSSSGGVGSGSVVGSDNNASSSQQREQRDQRGRLERQRQAQLIQQEALERQLQLDREHRQHYHQLQLANVLQTTQSSMEDDDSYAVPTIYR